MSETKAALDAAVCAILAIVVLYGQGTGMHVTSEERELIKRKKKAILLTCEQRTL
jgi:hypothetical protein